MTNHTHTIEHTDPATDGGRLFAEVEKLRQALEKGELYQWPDDYPLGDDIIFRPRLLG